MSSKKNKHGRREGEASGPAAGNQEEVGPVSAGGWKEDRVKTRWRAFPVAQAQERLRVAFSREAYAELLSHAKTNLQAEVCGVLAGEFCEDDEGLYVSVEAAIRGASAQHGASHVTYTQETWAQIFKELEEKHSGKQIVGWYHSHPGFGVAFSDMDLFIQKNFFSGRGQIAFVTDPLGGEEAICIGADDGVEYLSRFWVDARERRCRVPASPAKEREEAPSGELAQAIQSVEGRLSQALQALEAMRTSYYRFLTFIGMMVAVGILYWIGSTVFNQVWGHQRAPELGSTSAFLPVPVQVNGQWQWVGVTLVTQKIDPDSRLAQEMDRMQQEALREQQKGRKAGTQPAGGSASKPAPTTKEGSKP